MLRSVVFQGRKQFTAEYYATEIKNRSYKATQSDGYYKGYGNELKSALIGDTTFRVNSGLFLVQGRQCAIILGTTEDLQIPVQSKTVKGYIIARINTSVLTGENIEIAYKLGTADNFPSLIQQDTYNIDENTNAIYELPLYSFSIYKTISDIQKLIKPITNAQIEVDSGSGVPTDYLSVGGIFMKKIL